MQTPGHNNDIGISMDENLIQLKPFYALLHSIRAKGQNFRSTFKFCLRNGKDILNGDYGSYTSSVIR